MRPKYNPKSKDILKDSKIVVKTYPFLLPKNNIIELGMGKGDMIISLALKCPNRFFVGIEKDYNIAAQAVKKSFQYDLKNLKIMIFDIKDINKFLIGKSNEIWITFPDPWPKEKHSKRRLTSPTFLELYKSILSDDGLLKIKTDHDKFFEYSIKMLKNEGWIIKNSTNDLHNSIFNENNIMTNYEKKWSEKGKNINYLEANIKTII